MHLYQFVVVQFMMNLYKHTKHRIPLYFIVSQIPQIVAFAVTTPLAASILEAGSLTCRMNASTVNNCFVSDRSFWRKHVYVTTHGQTDSIWSTSFECRWDHACSRAQARPFPFRSADRFHYHSERVWLARLSCVCEPAAVDQSGFQGCQVHHLSMSEIPSTTRVAKKKCHLSLRYILSVPDIGVGSTFEVQWPCCAAKHGGKIYSLISPRCARRRIFRSVQFWLQN